MYKDWENDGLSFPAPVAEFSRYRQQVLEYLMGHSLSIRSEAEIKLNLPFEMTANTEVPYRGKFLLIHGLNDSTYVWTDMALVLAQRGYDVRAVLLPGHGSHPVNMLDISYKEWLAAARQHYALWDVDDTPMFLGGFSLGGVIATILALENPGTAGLLLISPAYHSQLNSLLRWSWIYAWFKPWMFGGMILEDNPVKYNSIPINSGTQYYRTTKYLKDHWGETSLDMPVLMVSTMNDSVVDIHYGRTLFQQRFTSKRKKLLIYTDDTTMTVNDNEVIRSSYYPQLRILNQSHLSLINAPNNPLVGRNGNQLVCNGNAYPIFLACLRARDHWFAAQNTPSPDGVSVARTTYNPDYNTIVKLVEDVFLVQKLQ